MKLIPRPEYPTPQFARSSWINLNGEWQFERDKSVSGRQRGLITAEKLSEKINVPFCMESRLSGIGDVDFCNCVWYKKAVDISPEWLEGGKRVILHIGACDYRTEVFVNGESVGSHIGGFVSFSFDITDYVSAGKNLITICADDDVRSHNQPGGKQSYRYASAGCSYTRTTGIWQTVWLENIPCEYIESVKYYTDVNSATLTVVA